MNPCYASRHDLRHAEAAQHLSLGRPRSKPFASVRLSTARLWISGKSSLGEKDYSPGFTDSSTRKAQSKVGMRGFVTLTVPEL
jgi:hypothetical protein